MNLTPDQRLAVEEFGKNIIVSAGAGSGKTEVLSKRVLEHVKNGIQIDELLILTFTNASAQEMKDRIRKKLIENNLLEQADKVDISYITTFDSFALSILKKYSYVLNLSKDISIIDNSIITLKRKEILTKIFDEYYAKKDELFLKLIRIFCLKDDKEVFDLILELNKKLDNNYDKITYLDNYIKDFYNDDKINDLISSYIAYLQKKIDQIRKQVDNLSSYVDSSYINKINTSLSSLYSSNTYEDIKYNSLNLDLPRLPKADDEAKKIKEEITKIKNDLVKLTKLNDINEIKESIYKTKDYVSIIIDIVKELDKKVMDYKYSVSSFEFIDIAKLSIKILEDNPYIQEDIKKSYKEILIDEYQDTNDLQDRFMKMIENSNCYMVGDIKQSIYRFRNANPMLFKSKYDLYSDGVYGLKIDLKENFRSRENVLQPINSIFNLIMSDNIGGAKYFEEHQMIFGLKNYLKVNDENYDMEFLNYTLDKEDKRFTKTEIEIFTIAKDIKEKINNNFKVMDKKKKEARNATYKDFAILLDKSKNFNLYKKIFEYLNIPVTIMRDKAISDSIDLGIFKNIYNLIISIYNKKYDTNFRYSFVAIARSYLFEMNDNDILKNLVDNTYFNTDLFKICQGISNDLDTLSNREVYERILKDFDIYNKLISIGNIKEHLITLDYIESIINNIDNYDFSVVDFYKYLDDIINENLEIKLSLNKEDNDSIKIMTIHTSKGLEYPICYFASLDSEFNIKELNNKICYSSSYGIVVPYYQDGLNNTIIKTLLRNKYLEDEISEKIRLFYVALTRAREKMIFVGSIKENILAYKDNEVIDDNTRLSYKSFQDILNSIYKYIKGYIKEVYINELGLTKDYKNQMLADIKLDEGNVLDVKEINLESNIVDKSRYSKINKEVYTIEGKNNVELGLKMHSILENLDFNNPDYTSLSSYEKELVAKFLDTKIFKGAKNEYREFEFITEIDNEEKHGIIDLLLEFEDHYIIVDYKLKNVDDDAYLKQLQGYQKYIESITSLPCDIYLYSIMGGELKKL